MLCWLTNNSREQDKISLEKVFQGHDIYLYIKGISI